MTSSSKHLHLVLVSLLLSSTLLPSGTLVEASIPIPSKLYDPSIFSKVEAVANTFQDPATFPQYTYPTNLTWKYFSPTTWTSSFFSSTLYLLHVRYNILCPTNTSSFASNSDLLDLARAWSHNLYAPVSTLTTTHDVGFLSLPFQLESEVSSVASKGSPWPGVGGGAVGGLNVGKGANYTSEVATLQAAAHLAARFNPVVGCTKSWDNRGDFEVIIDNMMNLELLWSAWLLTGNRTFFDIATSHADKTMANHIRADGSTFHVVDYNHQTGAVISRMTAQGLSDNSTWSRGQAWGIYGFAMAYNYTRNETYLEASRKLANWYMNHLPKGGVPLWDFNAPSGSPWDTSSATIASSALLLLSTLESSLSPPNRSGAKYWQDAGIRLVTNTINTAWSGDVKNAQSILKNGTVNMRASPPNFSTGVVYGDYYLVEVGNRLLGMGLADCSQLHVGG